MPGVFLNLILVSFATLSLASGFSFFFREKESSYIRLFTIMFSGANFFICAGYSLMGFIPNVDFAYIPRFFGLVGIDVFLLFELVFLLFELKVRQGIQTVIIGFFSLYVIFDAVIFGQSDAVSYVRYEFYTAYKNIGGGRFLFHYCYVAAIAITLLFFGVNWYKTKKIRHDKIFSLEVISANFIILFAAIPDIMHSVFTTKYPAFAYCAAFSFVYFSWYLACRWHINFKPTVKNVCKQLFYSLDIPILIFDLDGSLIFQNPFATQKFQIQSGAKLKIRDLFSFTDVETMLLLKKSREGMSEKSDVKVKITGESCILSTAIQFDSANEPFCIIGTVFLDFRQSEV